METDNREHSGILSSYLVFTALICCSSVFCFSQEPEPSAEQIKQSILARLSVLQSIELLYDRKTTVTYPRNDGFRIPKELDLTGTLHCAGTYRYLQGREMYSEDFIESNQAVIDVGESWPRSGAGGPSNSFVASALGLRFFAGDLYRTKIVTSELIETCDVDASDPNFAVLRLPIQNADPADQKLTQWHEWTFDKRKGYALTSYSRLYKGHDIIKGDRLVAEELKMTDFWPVEGIWLPRTIKYRTPYSYVDPPIDTISTVLHVKSFTLNNPKNTKTLYPRDSDPVLRYSDHSEESGTHFYENPVP